MSSQNETAEAKGGATLMSVVYILAMLKPGCVFWTRSRKLRLHSSECQWIVPGTRTFERCAALAKAQRS